MKNIGLIILTCCTLGACQGVDSNAGDAPTAARDTVSVAAAAATTPTTFDGANGVAIWTDPGDATSLLIVGTDAQGQPELYARDGGRVALTGERPVSLLDIRNGFALGSRTISLVIGVDGARSELVAYEMDAAEKVLRDVSGSIPPPRAEVEGLCMYHSPLSGKFYAFAFANGMMEQYELAADDDLVSMRLTRSVPVGHGASYCAVDDSESELYFSHEGLGVFHLSAEPESETEKQMLDVVQPFGPFAGDIKGMAIHDEGHGAWLIVSDADESRFQVYDLADHRHAGTFSVEGVDETEGVAARGGLLVVADDDNDGEHTNYKIVDWQAVATALSISGREQSSTAMAQHVVVEPSAETAPVMSFGDAADDPAIWVHPDDPSLSIIIGAQKQRGVNVYDLDGNLLQSRADGRINNVDLRNDFPLGDDRVALVAGSNRTTDSISVWAVDVPSRTLVDVSDGIIDTGMDDPYGACMYRSPVSGDFYVFVNDTDGLVRQWRLAENGAGRVGAEQVREFKVGSQTEGCVADDETGFLFVGEEDVGFWKYPAEPGGNDEPVLVDGVGENGNLTADVEGLAIYYGQDGDGYIVVSNQGADNYALYERQGDHAFIGIFHVVANGALGIDGISETDGLDVTSTPLGPDYPAGLFVAQDGRNISPNENQNFKLVSWQDIADAMGLD